MSQQEKDHDNARNSFERSSKQGGRESHFLPGASIEAKDSKATLVANVQTIRV